MNKVAKIQEALRFVAIAAVGWLADNVVFFMIVSMQLASTGVANFVGGIFGATITFMSARERLFANKSGRTWVRLSGYLLYTLALLVAASAAVNELTAVMNGWWPAVALKWTALLAKLIVTPFTLAMNYLAARFLSTR